MTGIALSRNQALRQAGFSATELIVVVAVIGILMAASMPFFFSAARTSALRGGAEQMVTVLGQARQRAIRDNTNVCVRTTGAGAVQYKGGGCGGAWGGTDTEVVRLANDITAGPPLQIVEFTYLGTTTAPATYSVFNPQDVVSTLNVSVAQSGRIFIGSLGP